MSHYDITNTPKRLSEGDTVAFDIRGTVLPYTVAKLTKNGEAGKVVLKQAGTARNRQVFDLLGMTGNDVLDFASQAFGYPATGDKWPRSHASDFAAQVRLVYAIFGKIASFTILGQLGHRVGQDGSTIATTPEPVVDPAPTAANGPVNLASLNAKLDAINAKLDAL